MTKREGYVYDKTSDWDVLKEASHAATRRKKNYGVRKYCEDPLRNLVVLQHSIERHEVHTGDYTQEMVKSGQDKWRRISKLKFYPDHIWQQSMVIASDNRIDKSLINDTYASRKGYGQIKAALRLKEWIKKDPDGTRWFAQFDIVKYYDNIPHSLLRQRLEHLFKDKAFVDAYMEPFEKYSDTGKSIPLGIRPSQSSGNLALSPLDRYAKETRKIRYYLRYLDDFVIFGKSKEEVTRHARKLERKVRKLGFVLHPTRIAPLSEGLDMLGWVYYDKDHLMYWRKADKVRYARRRSGVTNKRRIKELDDSAYGMLKWGNRDCWKYYRKMTGIDITKAGMKRKVRTDANGNVFIEAPQITARMVMDQEIEVRQIVRGITTAKGPDRMAWRIGFMGKEYKLIVNAVPIKDKVADYERYHITKFKTVMVDRGGNKYDLDENRTQILEIDSRPVELDSSGKVIYSDTKGKVPYFEVEQ